MLEILMLLVLALGLAKHKGKRGRRAMGRFIPGNIEENLSLGTLASGALVSDLWDESVNETTRISSIVVAWSMDLLTPGQGPFRFGVAHSDYTDAEIQEVIDNSGSWDTGNKISQEIGKRLVRTIGTMVGEGSVAAGDVRFNDGKPLKTKLNWILNSGDTLRMWVQNRSASAISTSVPVLKADGQANLWQTG